MPIESVTQCFRQTRLRLTRSAHAPIVKGFFVLIWFNLLKCMHKYVFYNETTQLRYLCIYARINAEKTAYVGEG